MIAREGRRVLAAAQFLTRVPCFVSPDEDLPHSSRYFPLIGAAVGALGAGVTLAAAAVLPQIIAVTLGLIATLLATGALHEDGLADSCDAFGGGRTREEVLRILHDPRIGAFGALGLGLLLALKISSLAHLAPTAMALALVCSHAFSRALSVAVMAFGHYARPEGGKTCAVAQGAHAADAAVAMGVGLVPFAFVPAVFLWALVPMLLAAGALYAYFRARIGGYTGDALGAVQQTSETACYVALAALL